jgi:predicted metal-dependent hydrolase
MGSRRSKSFKSTLELEAIGAPIEVRRHPAARRLTLRVSKTRRAVVVTVPDQCRVEEASRFVESNLDWVRERLGCVPAPVPFEDGARVPLRGRLHGLCFTGMARARSGARSVVEVVASPGAAPRLIVSGRLEHASRRLKDWLHEQARTDLDACVSRHSKTLGVKARSISLRDQTRLRGGARGRASHGDEPRPPLLEARGALHAAAGRGQALAAQPRGGSAQVRCCAVKEGNRQ